MTIQLTPNYQLPYPQLADTPNPPRDIQALAQKLDSVIATIVNSYIPIGCLLMWGPSGAAPSGWLICDGSEITRDLPSGPHAALFNTIGTTYGNGNASTTFNLPDLRGRMPMGPGTGFGSGASGSGKVIGNAPMTARSVGQWGGEENHTLQTAELASHAHTEAAAGSHSHGGGTAAMNQNNVHGHSIGGGVPLYNTSYGGAGVPNVMGGSNYSFPRQALGADNVDINHAHAISADGSHTHTINPAGSNAAHNNVEPFVVINFIIKYMNV